MKNKYTTHISNATGPVAVGDGASAHMQGPLFPAGFNYLQLEDELAQLKQAILLKGPTLETEIATGEIARAQMAAKNKEDKHVVEHLQAAGKWVLNMAKEIGLNVVANIIAGKIQP